MVGPSSEKQSINGLCILSQNIINEKIFLALWFWYVSLMAISSVFFVYRMLTIVVPSVRVSILSSKIGGSRRQVRQTVTRLLRHSRPGDWFVLNQVRFFKKFMASIWTKQSRARKKCIKIAPVVDVITLFLEEIWRI